MTWRLTIPCWEGRVKARAKVKTNAKLKVDAKVKGNDMTIDNSLVCG